MKPVLLLIFLVVMIPLDSAMCDVITNVTFTGELNSEDFGGGAFWGGGTGGTIVGGFTYTPKAPDLTGPGTATYFDVVTNLNFTISTSIGNLTWSQIGRDQIRIDNDSPSGDLFTLNTLDPPAFSGPTLNGFAPVAFQFQLWRDLNLASTALPTATQVDAVSSFVNPSLAFNWQDSTGVVSNNPGSGRITSVSASAVPEPSSFLFLMGVAILGGICRVRNEKSAKC